MTPEEQKTFDEAYKEAKKEEAKVLARQLAAHNRKKEFKRIVSAKDLGFFRRVTGSIGFNPLVRTAFQDIAFYKIPK